MSKLDEILSKLELNTITTEWLTNEINSYIDEVIDNTRPEMEKLIKQAIAEVIGEDDKARHTTGEYDDYKMCENCERVLGDDSDYDSKCICNRNNELRAEQRKRAGL